MRSICFLICWISAATAYGQDLTWKKYKIDTNLTVEFPAEVTILDTVTKPTTTDVYIKRYTSEIEGISLGVIVTTGSDVEPDNPESLKEFYKEAEEGILIVARRKNARFNVKDTTIDNIAGRSVIMFGGALEEGYVFRFYLFLVNGKLYTLLSNSPRDLSEIELPYRKKFLSSADFAANVREQKFATKQESLHNKAKNLLIVLFIVGLLIAAVIFFVVKLRI
jgi:hypothetical protein